ncbi:MAG: MFS transporter, partial [Ruthenibacterium sp.]
MKLNYKRTVFVGLAFMSICAFWQVYDSVIPLILKDTFGINDTWIGVVMAMDNVLALFMLPLFGKLSDATRTKIGRRMPYILGGTAVALLCLMLMPVAQKSHNLVLFFIGLGLVLIAMATYRSPAVALMPDVTPKPLRSQANAIINLMGAVGGMLLLVTMLLFPVTGDAPNYMAVFAILGLIMAVCIALLFWKIKENLCADTMQQESAAFGVSDDEIGEGGTDETGKMPRPVLRSLIFILTSVFL